MRKLLTFVALLGMWALPARAQFVPGPGTGGASAANIITQLQTLTGCNTSGYALVPQSSNCLAAGGISGLTTGYIPKASGPATVVNSAADDGITKANTFTYTGSGGITASAGPLTSGLPGGGVGSSIFLQQEGTAPGSLSASGQDNCYADSTQHGLLCNFNAGTTLPLVQGPASSTSGYMAVFGGTNGGTVKNGGLMSCTEVWGGSGTSFALTSGDDAIADNACYNDSGLTRTIVAVKCASDNGSNTTTVNPTFGSAGTGTTILSGALTCGNSNAMSSTGTVSNASWTTGAGINPAMSGTLTGTHIVMIVEYHY